ncbi:MAG: FAD binding domain-containing protein [Spirochaetaceae bacterium]|nr:FAD binding domain-containing protein [Spirochaetaceae bacterium]
MPTRDYLRPASIDEALAARAAKPEAAFIAGGTFLLSSDRPTAPRLYVDVGRLLGAKIERRGAELVLGAGATFQDLVDAPALPAALKAAAATMANRNVRNRATVGGNLGAGKSCSSLIPALLALEARVVCAERPDAAHLSLPLSSWLERPTGLVLEVIVPVEAGRRAAFARWSRSACDLSVLTAAASYRLDGPGSIRGLAVAAGGLGPRARRFPEIERLFEGGALPPRGEIEALVAPLLSPVDDHRGGAAFKRLRGASLVADAILTAEEQA